MKLKNEGTIWALIFQKYIGCTSNLTGQNQRRLVKSHKKSGKVIKMTYTHGHIYYKSGQREPVTEGH